MDTARTDRALAATQARGGAARALESEGAPFESRVARALRTCTYRAYAHE